jgi:hypothetical protein
MPFAMLSHAVLILPFAQIGNALADLLLSLADQRCASITRNTSAPIATTSTSTIAVFDRG